LARVAEHDPLKQGLKLQTFFLKTSLRLLGCRARSIKTRIETTLSTPRKYHFQVAEHDPLKQGLKPLFNKGDVPAWPVVAEHDPLKQGLKHGSR